MLSYYRMEATYSASTVLYARRESNSPRLKLLAGWRVVSKHGRAQRSTGDVLTLQSSDAGQPGYDTHHDRRFASNPLCEFSVRINAPAAGINAKLSLLASESQTSVGSLVPVGGTGVAGFNRETVFFVPDNDLGS